MITIDDRRPEAAPSISDFFKEAREDPWEDWKPVWTGKMRVSKMTPQDLRGVATPQDFQERHSPTETASIRLAEERRLHKAQRRVTDARLWEAMAPVQQDAAIEIALAFEMMGRGMGYVLNNWQRIPGCKGAGHISQAHARLISGYMKWARKCAEENISHAMAVDVLCFGFSCRMIDHDRRQRTGKARENLLRGLSLYAGLKGWG